MNRTVSSRILREKGRLDGALERGIHDKCECGYEWHTVVVNPKGDDERRLDDDGMVMLWQADAHQKKFHQQNQDGTCTFTPDPHDPSRWMRK